MTALYDIVEDNLEPNIYHVSFRGRMEDVNDGCFDILLNDTSVQIIPNRGHIVLVHDPMAPQPLRRQYTAHKHLGAEEKIEGPISNVLIGGWHDLSILGDQYMDTDCEALFQIYGHQFVVKRTRRNREIIYYIRDSRYGEMSWFKYPFMG